MNKEPQLNALAERLETFRQQLAGDAKATLALTPDDINLAIAAYEPFKDLRGTFRIAGCGRTRPCTSRFLFRSTANPASPGTARTAGSPPTAASSTAR